MFWQIEGTGLEAEPESVWEILEYRHSRFHRLQDLGPMVHVRLEATNDEVWVFASELIIEPEDVPGVYDESLDLDYGSEGYWHPADDPSFLTSSNYGFSVFES